MFAISVEAMPDQTASPVLDFPWVAFPNSKAERFMVDAADIMVRENDGCDLTVTVAWSEGISGKGRIIYERNGLVRQMSLPLSLTCHVDLKNLASFLAIQLDDTAKKYLWQQRTAITLIGQDRYHSAVTSQFNARCFREVFPRQGFTLYLIGWIHRQEFERIAHPLPIVAPCYFYPPKQNAHDHHVPGTKTANRYVLPGVLHPIVTLMEV